MAQQLPLVCAAGDQRTSLENSQGTSERGAEAPKEISFKKISFEQDFAYHNISESMPKSTPRQWWLSSSPDEITEFADDATIIPNKSRQSRDDEINQLRSDERENRCSNNYANTSSTNSSSRTTLHPAQEEEEKKKEEHHYAMDNKQIQALPQKQHLYSTNFYDTPTSSRSQWTSLNDDHSYRPSLQDFSTKQQSPASCPELTDVRITIKSRKSKKDQINELKSRVPSNYSGRSGSSTAGEKKASTISKRSTHKSTFDVYNHLNKSSSLIPQQHHQLGLRRSAEQEQDFYNKTSTDHEAADPLSDPEELAVIRVLTKSEQSKEDQINELKARALACGYHSDDQCYSRRIHEHFKKKSQLPIKTDRHDVQEQEQEQEQVKYCKETGVFRIYHESAAGQKRSIRKERDSEPNVFNHDLHNFRTQSLTLKCQSSRRNSSSKVSDCYMLHKDITNANRLRRQGDDTPSRLRNHSRSSSDVFNRLYELSRKARPSCSSIITETRDEINQKQHFCTRTKGTKTNKNEVFSRLHSLSEAKNTIGRRRRDAISKASIRRGQQVFPKKVKKITASQGTRLYYQGIGRIKNSSK